jgi:hypothetical protein
VNVVAGASLVLITLMIAVVLLARWAGYAPGGA